MNFFPILNILLIILILSNLINLKFKKKLNESYLISVSIIILFSFLLNILNSNYSVNILKYLLIIYSILVIFMIPSLINSFPKINVKLNIEFIIFILLIFFLSRDRYFLDQDEITYWGLAIKSFIYNIHDPVFFHHPIGLTLFNIYFYQIILMKFNNFF